MLRVYPKPAVGGGEPPLCRSGPRFCNKTATKTQRQRQGKCAVKDKLIGKGPIAKFFSPEAINELIKICSIKEKDSLFFTDDATVFQNSGGKIKLIPGEEKNIKITTDVDLKLAHLL